MKRSRTVVGVLAVALVLAVTGVARATAYTWIGGVDGDWNDTNNWSPAGSNPDTGAGSSDTYDVGPGDSLATTGFDFSGHITLDGATLKITEYNGLKGSLTTTAAGGTVEFPTSGEPHITKGTWGATAGSTLTIKLGNATTDGGTGWNGIESWDNDTAFAGAGDIAIVKLNPAGDSFLATLARIDMSAHTGTLDLYASVSFRGSEPDFGDNQTIMLHNVTLGGEGDIGDGDEGIDATLAGTGTIGEVQNDSGYIGHSNKTFFFATTGKIAPGTADAAGTIAFNREADLTVASGTDLEFNIFAGGTFDQLTFDTNSVFNNQTLADLFIEVEAGATLGTYDIITGGGTYASPFASVTWSDGAAGTISYGTDLIQINLTEAPAGAIPEPATVSLLVMGAVGLIARRRRK